MRPKVVLQLLVKHYTENRNSYLATMLGSFSLPMIMSLLSKSSEAGISLLMSVAIFNLFYVMYLSTRGLRQRRTFVMEAALPVSVTERYLFIMLNTTLLLAVWLLVICAAVVLIVVNLYPPVFPYVGDLIFKNYHLYIGLLCTHGVALLINLVARRRVIWPYLVAAVITMIAQYLISEYSPVGAVESVKMWVNICVAVVAWVVGYFMLRYRQLKM